MFQKGQTRVFPFGSWGAELVSSRKPKPVSGKSGHTTAFRHASIYAPLSTSCSFSWCSLMRFAQLYDLACWYAASPVSRNRCRVWCIFSTAHAKSLTIASSQTETAGTEHENREKSRFFYSKYLNINVLKIGQHALNKIAGRKTRAKKQRRPLAGRETKVGGFRQFFCPSGRAAGVGGERKPPYWLHHK